MLGGNTAEGETMRNKLFREWCPICSYYRGCYDESGGPYFLHPSCLTPIRPTPVAGDGAEADAGDIEGATRPAPEHDGYPT